MSAAATLFDDAPARGPEPERGPRTVSLVIPGNPRGKGRGRATTIAGHSTIYTPTATRNAEAEIRMIAAAAMQGRPPIEGPVALRTVAYHRIPVSWSRKKKHRAIDGEIRPTVKPDYDNIEKLHDAFKDVVWRDDTQVVDWAGRKFYSERPRTEVFVTALDAERVT